MALMSAFLVLTVQICFAEAAMRKLQRRDAPSWEEYWTEKLPNTPPPRAMTSLASPLNSLDTITLVKRLQAAENNPGVFDSPFCRDYGFLCTGDVHGPLICLGPYEYKYDGDRGGRCGDESKSPHTESQRATLVLVPSQVSKNDTSFHEAKNITGSHSTIISTSFHEVTNNTTFHQGKDVTMFNDSKNYTISHDQHKKVTPFQKVGNSANATTFHESRTQYTLVNEYKNDTKRPISNLFFRPTYLVKDSDIILPKLDNNLQGRSFLPAPLAAMMPFDTNHLERYKQIYEIPKDSNMAISMDYTMSFCNSTNHEVRRCHASIESMVDFVVQEMGSLVVSIVPSYSPTHNIEVHPMAAPVSLSLNNTTTMTCHDLMFPYLVYGCHVIPNSIVYNVELQSLKDSPSFYAPYVCHMDTKSWDPSHMAFIELDTQPGDGTICHWVPQNNIIWIST